MRNACEDRSRWCERVSQGAEVLVSSWRDGEREVTLNRHAQQAEKRASTLAPTLRLTLSDLRVPPTGSVPTLLPCR